MSPRSPIRRTTARALAAAGLALAALGPGTSPAPAAAQPVGAMFVEKPAPPVGGTYVPVVGNFSDADYYDDVLWYSPGAGPEQFWTDTDATFTAKGLGNAVNGTYTPIVGDFAGDALDDILWYAPGPAGDVLWTASGKATFTSTAVSIGGTYAPLVLDDDADKDDILWRSTTGGSSSVWSFTGSGTAHASHAVTVPPGTTPLTGDFDGDYHADLFWYGPGAVADSSWYGNGAGTFVKVARSVGGTYTPIVDNMSDCHPVKDIPDHIDDIVWYRAGAPSSYWEGTYGRTFTPTIMGTFTTSGTPLPGPSCQRMWVWSPTQPDQSYRYAAIYATENTEYGTGYTPIIGNWWGGGSEVLWYKPGAAPEALWL